MYLQCTGDLPKNFYTCQYKWQVTSRSYEVEFRSDEELHVYVQFNT